MTTLLYATSVGCYRGQSRKNSGVREAETCSGDCQGLTSFTMVSCNAAAREGKALRRAGLVLPEIFI